MLNLFKDSNIKNFYKKCLNENNYGLSEIQIIILTNKINNLHKHCLINKKDFHNKRGLILYVSKRKKLLKYLKRKNLNRYSNVIKFLELRKF